MRKTYKYRLLGNKVTFGKAEHWLELCRNLYNAVLEQRIVIYRQNKGQISCYDQIRQLPELKREILEYRQVGSSALQDVLERLDRAYRSFFRRVKRGEKAGFPRFKSKDRYDSFTLKDSGWKLNGKYLFVRYIGVFKIRLSRPIKGNIKTVTIRRCPTNKWYVCFNCDDVPANKLLESDSIVGIDVGVKSFCVDSDEGVFDNPHYLGRSLVLLRKKSRRFYRRVKHSNRRQIAKVLVAKVHEKVFNQRLDFIHKVANHYIKNYGILVFEGLSVGNLVKNHNIALSVSDASWGTFYRLCAYKAEEAGRQIIRLPRFEPTSKMCSECGSVNHTLEWSERQWVCKSCGVLHDRDYNAAKNIRRVGQTLQEQTYANR